MANNSVIYIVGTQCQVKDDAKFNKWYNEIHVPMLMKSGKVQSVSRYKVIGNPDDPPRYIAIYKFANLTDYEAHEASPKVAAARKEMRETWGKDAEVISRAKYELLKEF